MKFTKVYVHDSCGAIEPYREGELHIWFDGSRSTDSVHLLTAAGWVPWVKGTSIRESLLGKLDD